MEPLSPVVAAHELGSRLRVRRDTLGLSGQDVARAARCSPQFLSQVENGKRVLAVEKLQAVTDLLELDPGEVDELLDLRVQATRRGPLATFSGIFSATLLRYYGFEHGCEAMYSYNGGVVHGLLQTPEYARAVIAAGGARIRQAEVDRRVQARMLRQDRLTGDYPLTLSVVMSEAALRQQIGGPEVMRAQLRHLTEQVEALDGRLDLRVIPFDVRGHPMLSAPDFHLLGFPSTRLPDMVWFEVLTGMQAVEDEIAVHEYRLAHNATQDTVALAAVDSLRLIAEAARGV